MTCIDTFETIYHHSPNAIAFCPYRICPIGAHSDHQYGKVTGLAIDMGVHFAYSPKQNGVIELKSLNFEKRAQFHINKVPETKQNDWADYLRGATSALGKIYPLNTGLAGVIEGTLPIGGLSSSAAVTLVFLQALSKVNGIHIHESELVEIVLNAENEYVGVSVGKLDPSCEVYSKKDHLLHLDFVDESIELIPQHSEMKPYEIAIFFSGLERTLVGSKFNMRVDELKSAAYAMKAYAIEEGLEDELKVQYGKFSETRLRDVPLWLFERYKERLPSAWRMRAEHFYSEMERVTKGAEAWRQGDIDTFGKLSFESGYSSIHSYQTGSDELKALYEIMLRTDGIYGGRFSGAGFNGCCMALIDPKFHESIEKKVSDEYIKVFPKLKDRFSAHFCHSTDGMQI